MKRSVLIFLAVITFGVSFAQSVKEEVFADVNKMCSNHLRYQIPNEKYTVAPKGYKPVYISHYGRHGSRYHWGNSDYQYFYDLFKKAEQAGVLTDLGKSVAERMYRLYADAYLRAGDLTQTGRLQHAGIAERMVKNFPEVFDGKAVIDVSVSTSQRCIMSMDAFCSQLKAMCPDLQITAESSKRLMYFICNDSWDTVANYLSNPKWKDGYDDFHSKHVKPERMMKALFSDSLYVLENIDAVGFMRKLHEIHGTMQGIDDLDFDFADVFTQEELYGCWLVQNAWWYGAYGACPMTNSRGAKFAKNLLKHILDEADKALSGDGANATLRFGHDTGLLPLASLMQLEGCNSKITDLEKLSESWCDFKIIPMAGNLQMIFYKSKKSNDVLVKVLLNEREVDLPISSDIAPYYNWNDVEQFYRNVILED
ncbi:MAG: histidine phosphatase family protein [Bacteroidales bacterium]|nr:histidine phosphatase family protein [Bacteroidales bacterium]